MFWKKIDKFFDKLEDRVRGKLSHKPIIYGFIGGIGIVLFWRGVWHTADYLSALIYHSTFFAPGLYENNAPWWDGPLSFLIGSILLLITGLFVSSFIGNEIIITGLKGEHKITEKTEEELKSESEEIKQTIQEVKEIRKRIENIEKILIEKK
jgi:hypothetical protein